MNATATLTHCRQLDIDDPLHHLRDQFSLPTGIIYLDGNSLGALPKATANRVAEVIAQEWGHGLIRSWNSAGWIDQPARLGDKSEVKNAPPDDYTLLFSSLGLNVAPAKTPPAVVTRLNEAMRKALAKPEVKAPMEKLGAVIVGDSPVEFAAYLTRDYERWEGVIRAANIKADTN